MLFWDNWIKKFSEKFSKIVIISAYGRNNWSKRKCFRETVNSSRFLKDKRSHIYLHLEENPQCQERVNFDFLKLEIVLLLFFF